MDGHIQPSLQQSFLQYKLRRQEAIRQAQKQKNKQLEDRKDSSRMQDLRIKFVEQAKKYFGVPYARRYWKEDEPEYQSPLFLDCCGLVRRVLRDLQPDFGFEFGPWNQAYQYDTLPMTLNTKEQMQPGDLVFIAAIYYNTKSKRQKHDMVHVEIWLGDGDKTIGARWQRGKVQVHDSYMFDAKSYHSPTYIFKSIDTWLIGICESHCPEHKWRLPCQFKPDEKSIFYSADLSADSVGDENASDSEEEAVCTCTSICTCVLSLSQPMGDWANHKPFIYALPSESESSCSATQAEPMTSKGAPHKLCSNIIEEDKAHTSSNAENSMDEGK